MNIKNLMVIVIAICLGISFNVFAKKNDESNERYNDYYSDDYKQRYDDDRYYEDSYSYSSDNYYNYEYSDDEDSYNHDDYYGHDYYGHDYYGHEYDDSGKDKKDKKDKKTDRHLVYNLIGTGNMFIRNVPDIDGDGYKDEAFCFKVKLVNLKNKKEIGTAVDCLSQIDGDNPGGGIKLVGTTYFKTPHGKLVTRGETTVQPVLQETVTPSGVEMTHITGASSKDNSVLYSTGRFKNSKGTVRLSGMVNLTDFTGDEGSPMTFDCLFVIDLKSSDDYSDDGYSHNYYSDEDDTDYSDSDYSSTY